MGKAHLVRRFGHFAGALLAAAPAVAGTFVVDDSGGADFTDVPPAIAAAAPGDLILVRDGLYSSFFLEKGLAIVADGGAEPQWDQGFAWVRNVPAGQTATLAGLNLQTLRIQACDGTVLIDDCTLEPGSYPLNPPVVTALSVVNCDLVVLSRSHFAGASGSDQAAAVPQFGPVPGADLHTSKVIASQCSFDGGGGSTLYKSHGLTGQPAIQAQSTLLVLQGSSAHGGRGGHGWNFPIGELLLNDGGDGAPALELDACTLQLFGAATDVIEGGQGGEPSDFLAFPGDSAPALSSTSSDTSWSGVSLQTFDGVPIFDLAGGSLVAVLPAVPTLVATGSGLLGDALSLQLAGPANAAYLLWVSPFSTHLPLGAKPMPLLLGAPLIELGLGALDPAGAGSLPLVVPALPVLQGVAANFQAFVKPAAGPSGLSTSTSLILR